MKLINVESVPAHRLVSGCLVNLTTTREVTWELIQAKGHQVNFDARENRLVVFRRLERGQSVQYLSCCCIPGVTSLGEAKRSGSRS